MAKQYADAFTTAAALYQFALQTRACAEAIAHVLRHLSHQDEDSVIVSLDGIGAFDHVSRAAFLQKLVDVPQLQSLVPLAAALYGSDSRFRWSDADGVVHTIVQAEGASKAAH